MNINRFLVPFLVWFISSLTFILVAAVIGEESAFLPAGICLMLLAISVAAHLGIRWMRWIGVPVFFLFALLCLLGGIDSELFILLIPMAGYAYMAYDLLTLFKTTRETTPVQPNLPPQTFQVENTDYRYPWLQKRVISIFIDGMLIIFVMIQIMYLTEGTEWSTVIRVASGLILVGLYEPLLTAYDSTVGQRLMGIRVRDDGNPSLRISVGRAYVRYVVKLGLGWLSFVTIHFNDKHQALHDLMSSSVMIIAERRMIATA
jgi:uncharacterized RDD family membrane protein YckC